MLLIFISFFVRWTFEPHAMPQSHRIKAHSIRAKYMYIGARPMGLRGAVAPLEFFQITIFGQQNLVIFGQNHLTFGQAVDKIFGQLTSAPLNKTGTVRLWSCKTIFIKLSETWQLRGLSGCYRVYVALPDIPLYFPDPHS